MRAAAPMARRSARPILGGIVLGAVSLAGIGVLAAAQRADNRTQQAHATPPAGRAPPPRPARPPAAARRRPAAGARPTGSLVARTLPRPGRARPAERRRV